MRLVEVDEPAEVGARLDRLAREISISNSKLAKDAIAAYLHDVGRVGVSNRIWAKTGALSTAEWEQVHLHPYHSERVLASTAAFKPMARIAGMHHERIDGSGYYRGCRGKDVDIATRVLACADAFEAMTQRRPHRAAMEPGQARDALLGEARFDIALGRNRNGPLLLFPTARVARVMVGRV